MAAAALAVLIPCCYKGTGAAFSDDVATESSHDPAAEDWALEEIPPFDAPDEIDGVDVSDTHSDSDAEDWTDTVDSPAEPDAQELPPGLVWISIPAGMFEMGCSLRDTECESAEEPHHTVTVPAFQMTETEITQAQYEAVTGETPSYFVGCPDCPVEQLNWHEAKAFCEAIGGRLPSEAEWEYAARAGTTTRYYCGDDAACLDGIAWYGVNSGSTTHAVKGKAANAFGLYDMLGNVRECMEDCWHWNYTGAPSTGEVWTDGDCSFRVVRGGSSWSFNSRDLCASYRSGNFPGTVGRSFGFRCAR